MGSGAFLLGESKRSFRLLATSIGRACLGPSVEGIQDVTAVGPLRGPAEPGGVREPPSGGSVGGMGLRQSGGWAVRAELPIGGSVALGL